MSASMYYRPIEAGLHNIPTPTPQSFMDMLAEAFGDRCPTLSKDSLNTLHGLKAGSRDAQMKKCFETLVDAIHKYGSIEIIAKY